LVTQAVLPPVDGLIVLRLMEPRAYLPVVVRNVPTS